MKLHVYCDGGARGNPGPAASAFVVYSGENIIYKKGKYLGINTNNFAEYSAVFMAMEWLRDNGKNVEEALFTLDSELVVKQLNGQYKVKSQNLKPFVDAINGIRDILSFKTIVTHSRREDNRESDALVNETLDSNLVSTE